MEFDFQQFGDHFSGHKRDNQTCVCFQPKVRFHFFANFIAGDFKSLSKSYAFNVFSYALSANGQSKVPIISGHIRIAYRRIVRAPDDKVRILRSINHSMSSLGALNFLFPGVPTVSKNLVIPVVFCL